MDGLGIGKHRTGRLGHLSPSCNRADAAGHADQSGVLPETDGAARRQSADPDAVHQKRGIDGPAGSVPDGASGSMDAGPGRTPDAGGAGVRRNGEGSGAAAGLRRHDGQDHACGRQSAGGDDQQRPCRGQGGDQRLQSPDGIDLLRIEESGSKSRSGGFDSSPADQKRPAGQSEYDRGTDGRLATGNGKWNSNC